MLIKARRLLPCFLSSFFLLKPIIGRGLWRWILRLRGFQAVQYGLIVSVQCGIGRIIGRIHFLRFGQQQQPPACNLGFFEQGILRQYGEPKTDIRHRRVR